jgi:AraC-like DNA-binding protein/mannose-6-phosphate isomerase-like protein (cupin superfamily)
MLVRAHFWDGLVSAIGYSNLMEPGVSSSGRRAVPALGQPLERFPMAMRIPKAFREDHYRTIDPQINAKGIHQWPFDPCFPVDVRFLTNGRNPNVRMNRHEYFEVLYLVSGSATLRIQDRSLPFSTGDVSIVGSTLYHRVEPTSDCRFTVAALFFLPEVIRSEGASDSSAYLIPFLLQDARFPHIIPARTGTPEEILGLMQKIRAELPASTQMARLAAKTYLKLLLLLLVQRYSSYAGTIRTFEQQQRALARLQPLFAYVEDHFSELIRLERVCRISGMSISHFISFFKNATGQSFLSYLNHYRIERAQQLLATTEKSVTVIGQETGFCDQSYFGMVFRRLVGMTPSAYRRQVQGDEVVATSSSNSVSLSYLRNPASGGTASMSS